MTIPNSGLPPANAANMPTGGGGSSTGIPVPLPVTLSRTDVPLTNEVSFWALIQASSRALSFDNYERFVRNRFAGKLSFGAFVGPGKLDAYELLKETTEEFLLTHCGTVTKPDQDFWTELALQARRDLGRTVSGEQLEQEWIAYAGSNGTLPLTDQIRRRRFGFIRDDCDPQPSTPAANTNDTPDQSDSYQKDVAQIVIQAKIRLPCLIELIWSYWYEEAMLVQVLNAISLRFQNRRGPAERYLAHLELEPLRRISNLMWGYVQEEQHRLTIPRRAAEYDHLYGVILYGRAVGRLDPADSRSQFLEGFHRLLHLTARFYQQDDDTTIRADAFPILNALKEVHMTLAEGGSNQFGDLTWVARTEMMMQQLILSLPEMREFLASRPMVIYPETWMDRLEAAKSILGMEGPNILHMHNLATMGERIVISLRYHVWSGVKDANEAANWARDFRADVQGYIHSYHAATGVDLSATAVTSRIDATMPALLLHRRQELARRR
jgi:hypothetical protein